MRVYISELIVIRDGEISTRVRSCISDLAPVSAPTVFGNRPCRCQARPVRTGEGALCHCAQVVLVD